MRLCGENNPPIDGGGSEWKRRLQRLALSLHCLVSMPEHEYDRLQMAEAGTADVEIRMTDAREWFG